MAIDHLSFGTHDLEATTAFYRGQLGFELLLHEWILLEEGGRVDHAFFDCGGGCCLAFMQWIDVPGVPTGYVTDINRGLGVPAGTFHFAFRCDSLEALEERRLALISTGVVVGELLDLNPYRSFFFNDPVNGLRLEYTVRLRDPGAGDRDPLQRQLKTNLGLFAAAAIPSGAGAT
ncbi:MAG: VOC family protein [Cyanobacteria bacterium]|nr:VOC family protein [Cyanobacteriota bacterium]